MIIEGGYLVFFAALLVPPVVSTTNDMLEAIATIVCLLLIGGLTGIFKHHEWIFDIISAILFGVFVQLVLVGSPVSLCIQVFGLALITAGIARGVGLNHAPAIT